jgi:hypothetical protein
MEPVRRGGFRQRLIRAARGGIRPPGVDAGVAAEALPALVGDT